MKTLEGEANTLAYLLFFLLNSFFLFFMLVLTYNLIEREYILLNYTLKGGWIIMNYKYLLFCTSCGCPTEIPTHILNQYISNHVVKVIYCHTCQNANKIPDYLKKIAKELK